MEPLTASTEKKNTKTKRKIKNLLTQSDKDVFNLQTNIHINMKPLKKHQDILPKKNHGFFWPTRSKSKIAK